MNNACEYKRLSSRLRYEPDTGNFFWLIGCGKVKPGDKASYIKDSGYITLGKRRVPAHRVAWFIFYKENPPEFIDHINGDRCDNRICNLRAATISQNQMNKKKGLSNTSGVKGVHFDSWSGRWRAEIKLNGIKMKIGRFTSKEEAHKAYCEKAKELFGEFWNPG